MFALVCKYIQPSASLGTQPAKLYLTYELRQHEYTAHAQYYVGIDESIVIIVWRRYLLTASALTEHISQARLSHRPVARCSWLALLLKVHVSADCIGTRAWQEFTWCVLKTKKSSASSRDASHIQNRLNARNPGLILVQNGEILTLEASPTLVVPVGELPITRLLQQRQEAPSPGPWVRRPGSQTH